MRKPRASLGSNFRAPPDDRLRGHRSRQQADRVSQEPRPRWALQSCCADADPVRGIPCRCRAAARALQASVETIRAEAELLRARARPAEAKAALDARLLRELDDILELAPQLRVDLQTEELRGERLRQVAIEILRSELGAGESIHYRDWFRLVRAAGHRVAGKDPVATFLTQVSRSEAVEPMGARSGRYRLRAAA